MSVVILGGALAVGGVVCDPYELVQRKRVDGSSFLSVSDHVRFDSQKPENFGF